MGIVPFHLTKKAIEDIVTTIETDGILFVDASEPMIIDERISPAKYLLNDVGRHQIVNILCAEYEITK